MKKRMKEVRWHGRGGQGAKTAAFLLAEAAMDDGKYFQGFPEYGPEREGAPIKAYTRISDRPILQHDAVSDPDVVIVLDDTLLGSVPVTDGVVKDTILMVNTKMTPDEVAKKIDWHGGRVYTIRATDIAMETIGKPIPNTPMIGALIGATGMINEKALESKISHKFLKKLGQEGVDANVEAVSRAIEEVKKK